MRFFSNNRDPRDGGQVFMAIIFILSGYPLTRVGHIDEVWYIGSQLMWTIDVNWKE